MLGVIVNTLGIIAGATIGLIIKKGIPERVTDTIMKGICLCVMTIGISGALKGENFLIMIISVVLGGLVGELMDLEDSLRKFADKIEQKYQKPGDTTSLAGGFVTASLIFCIGAMAVVGSLQAGISGDNEMLYTKSMLDTISSIIFATSMGLGVLFSAIPVFLYQGSIVLLAGLIAPYLSETVVNEMTAVGSLLIIAISLNMLKLTNVKIMNLMPAIFVPIFICQFF